MKRVYLYIDTTVPNLQKYEKKKKKKKKKQQKKWDSGTGTRQTGTGTTCAKSGSGHSVLVPHLLVPVPPGVHGFI